MANSFEEFSTRFKSNNLLRRKPVGVVYSPLGSHNQVIGRLDEAFDLSFNSTDLLDLVTPSYVDSLTARRFCELCLSEGLGERNRPKTLIGFDALFGALRRKAQETVSSRLSHTEPLEPLIILTHSPFTKNRLRNEFSEHRFLRWKY